MIRKPSSMDESSKGGDDLLKAFVDRSKKSQQQRDRRKIQELEEQLAEVKSELKNAEEEHRFIVQHLQNENRELRIQNIRLDSQNKAGRAKCVMLEDIIKEARSNTTNPSLSEMAAFRLLQEENKELKKLIKQFISKEAA